MRKMMNKPIHSILVKYEENFYKSGFIIEIHNDKYLLTEHNMRVVAGEIMQDLLYEHCNGTDALVEMQTGELDTHETTLSHLDVSWIYDFLCTENIDKLVTSSHENEVN